MLVPMQLAVVLVASGLMATNRLAPSRHVARAGRIASPLASEDVDLGRLRTAELKQRLLSSCAEFKSAQQAQWALQDASGVEQSSGERVKSPLKAEGFGNVEVATGDAALAAVRDGTIRLVEALAERNPTPNPLDGWKAAGGSPLEGTWKLLFTTGADATFRPSNKTGAPRTYQQIDSRRGLFINCVDFAKAQGKLEGFRVVVGGKALSATEVSLSFLRVKLLRRARFRWLRTLVIPLPPGWLLRAVARWASRGKAQLSRRGAGFTMLYLDDELRMHKTFDGQYFVQQRSESETFYADANVAVPLDGELTMAQRQAGALAATALAYGRKQIGASGAPNGYVWGQTF